MLTDRECCKISSKRNHSQQLTHRRDHPYHQIDNFETFVFTWNAILAGKTCERRREDAREARGRRRHYQMCTKIRSYRRNRSRAIRWPSRHPTPLRFVFIRDLCLQRLWLKALVSHTSASRDAVTLPTVTWRCVCFVVPRGDALLARGTPAQELIFPISWIAFQYSLPQYWKYYALPKL